ncbi:MAG TPA: diaminopimelate epimerase [Rhizomicrobium sp.]|jgi:diaminopimelate epimerase|nr:diaminopimelate epimerase [Rhizomicrobium sp.]
MTPFYKMQGLGNDFVVFDARNHGLALDEAAARAIADRRLGVGCDQVIVIEQPRARGDAMMRIFNADGDEVEACGNGARCVARLLMEERDETTVRIDTLGGLVLCSDAGAGAVTADMGVPGLQWQDIPLADSVDTRAFALPVDGEPLTATAVSMGNPHCVIFVDNAERAPVAELGARIEKLPLFPERTNVEFVSVPSPGRLRMRVWERGAGITRACGTGACAAAVAAHRRELGPRAWEVILDGGMLSIDWRETDDHVLMTGDATLAFTGQIDLAMLGMRQ